MALREQLTSLLRSISLLPLEDQTDRLEEIIFELIGLLEKADSALKVSDAAAEEIKKIISVCTNGVEH